jgi:hypothetical protein
MPVVWSVRVLVVDHDALTLIVVVVDSKHWWA